MNKTLFKSLSLAVIVTAIMAENVMASPLLELSTSYTFDNNPYSFTIRVGDGMGAGGVGGTIHDHVLSAWTTTTADNNTASGMVGYAGRVGDWYTDTSIGSTKPSLGTAGSPQFQLTSINKSGTYAGDNGILTIRFSDINYGPLDADLTGFVSKLVTSVIQPSKLNTNIIQTLDVYCNTNNQYFATQTLIASLGITGAGFSNFVFEGVPSSSPFSITMVATVDQDRDATSSFNASVSPVPEPATILLMGAGLVGLATGTRRWTKKGKQA